MIHTCNLTSDPKNLNHRDHELCFEVDLRRKLAIKTSRANISNTPCSLLLFKDLPRVCDLPLDGGQSIVLTHNLVITSLRPAMLI